MKAKKTSKANLENKKLFFKEIGLLLSIMLITLAFNWSTSVKAASAIETDNVIIIDEDQIPITHDIPPPPPEIPKEPIISDIIDIVDNDITVEDNVLFTTEDDKNLGVKVIEYKAAPKEEKEIEEDAIPFAIVEKKPEFQGGDQNDFTKWVFKNIVYPEIAKENGIAGRVTLQFTVETDGSVKNVKVLRGVDSSLDKEAIRVVSNSPKWTPGEQRGKPVKVQFTFPVIFQLK